MNRKGLLAWTALVVPLWIVMILCTHWEPVVRDGWSNIAYYHSQHLSLHEVWRLIADGWLGSNPRLGQTLTTVLYAPGPYHTIATPILELLLLWIMTALVLGRAPSVRRADDALVYATTTALFIICTPQLGPMLFYRPFFGNYTFGLLLNLAWLLPYRFRSDGRWWWSPLLLVLGVAAGMCNEHTGPTFVALGIAAMYIRREVRAWMIAGLLGLAAGYVLLLVAPGHAARYNGLAKEAGILGRIVDRGFVEDVRVVARLGLYMAWSLPWLALGAAARTAGRIERDDRLWMLGFAAGGLLATCVLLGSPKLGPRLYVHSTALVAMGISGWLTAQLAAAWARKACALLSVGVIVFAEVKCVLVYRETGAVYRARIEAIETGAGKRITVEPYPVRAGKWFLGEDFASPSLRENLAADYMLLGLELAGHENDDSASPARQQK